MRTHKFQSRILAGAAAVVVLGTILRPGIGLAADAPAGAMSIPPPVKDPVLTSWQGTWEGESTLGNQKSYTELVFAPTVGGQWLEGRMRLWTDKTRKHPVMDFAMFLRPGSESGTFKAYAVSSDGSGSTATCTTANGVQSWVWSNDNDTKETATLTMVTADHMLYSGAITDKTGAKLMDIVQDLSRRAPKMAGTPASK